MAKATVAKTEYGKPCITTFDFDEKNLYSPKLKVKVFTDYNIEWAQFIIANRNNHSDTPIHDYDIVYGPIANDKVGVQLWKFENQMIDLETFTRNLHRMEGITFQYFFGTERAIKLLKKL